MPETLLIIIIGTVLIIGILIGRYSERRDPDA